MSRELNRRLRDEDVLTSIYPRPRQEREGPVYSETRTPTRPPASGRDRRGWVLSTPRRGRPHVHLPQTETGEGGSRRFPRRGHPHVDPPQAETRKGGSRHLRGPNRQGRLRHRGRSLNHQVYVMTRHLLGPSRLGWVSCRPDPRQPRVRPLNVKFNREQTEPQFLTLP